MTVDPLRTGVVGGGLIAQAAHLPTMQRLRDRFQLVALADPSVRVRSELADRYRPLSAYAAWEEMLEAERLDACVVCSPHATHADVALAALDLRVHVFVEKPLCITVDDAERIAARAGEQDRVVQVGYMKRFDPATVSLLASLPDDAEDLRLIDAVTYDPWMAGPPFFSAGELVLGDDVPAREVARLRAAERRQVEEAVGRDDDATVRAYSYTYLACLVHDVNLVHAMLERMGVPTPSPALSGADWAEGEAASIAVALPAGGRCRATWLLLRGLQEYREQVTAYFADAIHRLTFPAPYLGKVPAVHEVVSARDGATVVQRRSAPAESYLAELRHFHDCVVEGTDCLTPPEQAVVDLTTLRDAFLAGAHERAGSPGA
jgi:predicted dehydrogenase